MKSVLIFLGLVLLLFSCGKSPARVEEVIVYEQEFINVPWSWAGHNVSMDPNTGVTEWLIVFRNFSDLDSTFIDVEKPKGAVMLWTDGDVYLGAWTNGLSLDRNVYIDRNPDYDWLEVLAPGKVAFCFIRTTDVGPRSGLLLYSLLGLSGDDEVPRDMTPPDTSGGNILGQGVIQWTETADNRDTEASEQTLDKLVQRLEQDWYRRQEIE